MTVLGGTLQLKVSARTALGEKLARMALKEKGNDAEARRYLMVNGLIPLTKENAKDILSFNIDAEHVPKDLADKIVQEGENAQGEKNEPEYIEAEQDDTESVDEFELDEVWVEKGKIKDVRLVRKERHTETATYHYSLKKAMKIE